MQCSNFVWHWRGLCNTICCFGKESCNTQLLILELTRGHRPSTERLVTSYFNVCSQHGFVFTPAEEILSEMIDSLSRLTETKIICHSSAASSSLDGENVDIPFLWLWRAEWSCWLLLPEPVSIPALVLRFFPAAAVFGTWDARRARPARSGFWHR